MKGPTDAATQPEIKSEAPSPPDFAHALPPAALQSMPDLRSLLAKRTFLLLPPW